VEEVRSLNDGRYRKVIWDPKKPRVHPKYAEDSDGEVEDKGDAKEEGQKEVMIIEEHTKMEERR
jgi:hypothetical protein